LCYFTPVLLLCFILQYDIVMGTLAGILRVFGGGASGAAGAASFSVKDAQQQQQQQQQQEADVDITQYPVLAALDQLARWNEKGHVPTQTELKGLGVELPSYLA
jgi:hypothetical protein